MTVLEIRSFEAGVSVANLANVIAEIVKR